jgi:hypothetical protein
MLLLEERQAAVNVLAMYTESSNMRGISRPYGHCM